MALVSRNNGVKKPTYAIEAVGGRSPNRLVECLTYHMTVYSLGGIGKIMVCSRDHCSCVVQLCCWYSPCQVPLIDAFTWSLLYRTTLLDACT